VARIFLFLRRFKPVRERVTLGEKNDHVEREHVARYRFACQYCTGKHVADIACGTGYGMKILSEVAGSVDGYDRELLGQNFVIDLETQGWERSYDVVVSFETIEHLANPEFFLRNASKTAKLLIVSTPIGEFRGYNPFHKQVWTKDEFTALLEQYFVCQYFYQDQERIEDHPLHPIRFLVAVARPRDRVLD
jgi:2-polyprenyl-3-methyl-5-hydroxy-6-metoxy-1,4-benzoquinol methylase